MHIYIFMCNCIIIELSSMYYSVLTRDGIGGGAPLVSSDEDISL